jgi:lysophospholipase L1-like esterase
MSVALRPWNIPRDALVRCVLILAYLAVLSNAEYFLPRTSGIVTFVLATALVVTSLLAVKSGGELIASSLGWKIRLYPLTLMTLVVGSALTSVVLIEVFLQLISAFESPKTKDSLLPALAMPREWERRIVQLAGARHAEYWHGHLHVYNRDGMRVPGDFPPSRPGVFRVITLGDSLTYGYGIAEQDTYPRVLEALLNDTFRVEVLNLGVAGAQSEDIYKILQRKLPVLRPDLVFYGVCLNDFLPSGVREYSNNRAYQIPFPYKEHFIRKTLTGKLVEKGYDVLLMRVGLRVDFFTDILRDFNGYQTRFARDVKAMNDLVRGYGLPPVVAMVLDQYPNTKEDRYEIVVAAEKHLRAAGIRVVASDYIRLNDGRMDWHVSPWEGHPNERANKVFAQEIAKVLRGLPELQPFQRQDSDEGQRRRASASEKGKPRGRER